MEQEISKHFNLLMKDIVNELKFKVKSIHNKLDLLDGQKTCEFVIQFEEAEEDKLELIITHEPNGIGGWFKNFFWRHDKHDMFAMNQIANAIGQKIRDRETEFWKLFQQY